MDIKKEHVLAGAAVMLLVASLIWLYGKLPRKIGGDMDAHGCLAGAGFSWCDAREKCLRPFEETCTAVPGKIAPFACEDGKRVIATFYPSEDKQVDLILDDGMKIAVPRAVSGSGARYSNSDETFVFWNKADTAFIEEKGKLTYVDCVTGALNIDDMLAQRSTVDEFGKKLQSVNLSAPKEQMVSEAQANYAGLVSEGLLAKWRSSPNNIPGRKTSSPWPDRIALESIDQKDNGAVAVTGQVIEVTSVETVNGGEAGRYPIELELQKIGDNWLITNVK